MDDEFPGESPQLRRGVVEESGGCSGSGLLIFDLGTGLKLLRVLERVAEAGSSLATSTHGRALQKLSRVRGKAMQKRRRANARRGESGGHSLRVSWREEGVQGG